MIYYGYYAVLITPLSDNSNMATRKRSLSEFCNGVFQGQCKNAFAIVCSTLGTKKEALLDSVERAKSNVTIPFHYSSEYLWGPNTLTKSSKRTPSSFFMGPFPYNNQDFFQLPIFSHEWKLSGTGNPAKSAKTHWLFIVRKHGYSLVLFLTEGIFLIAWK